MDDKMQVLIDLIIQKSKARNDLQKELKELQKDAQIKTDIKVNISDVRKARKELEQFSGKALNGVKFNIDTEKYSTDIAKITAQLGRYGDASDSVFAKAKSSADSLIKTYKEMESAFGDNSSKYTDDQRVEIERRYQQELAKTKNLLAQLNINKDNEIVSVGDEKRVNMINTLNNYLSKNTAITRGSKEQIREWIRILSSSDDMTIGSIKNINTEFKTLDATMRQAGKLGLSWTDKLKQTWEKFGGWSIATGALTKTTFEIRQAVSELKELDSILTEISKTSDLTTRQLEELGKKSFNTASGYGRKAGDYLTGIQEMYRAGFDNAEEMAELSVRAQSAGDMDATAANNYIIATNAAYKYKGSVEELNKVLDGQNYITNNAAISMKDISDATSETASVAAQYGVEIDELSALIATATANTRESGSEVGTALKAIMINLQDPTSDAVTDTFDKLGISMYKMVDGSERLKTPIELIYELADAYNSLPEGHADRALILNEIGQKRHANTLASILSDMEGFEDMLDLYNNSAAEGSALREAGKSANNLEGSLNRLSNSWTKLVNSFVNSKGLTSAVNSLNDLVNVAQDLIDKFGAIPMLIVGIGTALGTIKGVKDGGLGKIIMDAAAGGFKKIDIRTEVDSTEVDALQAKIATLDGDEVKIRAAVDESSLGDIPGLADYAVDQANKGETIDTEGVNILNTNYIAQQAQGYKGVNAAMQKYNELRKESNGAELKFAETVGKSNKNLGKYLKGLNGAKAGMTTYGISLVKATVKTVALQAATMALNAVISFGISAVISGLITLFDKLHTSESEAADAAAEAYEKAAEQAEKVKQKEDIAISGAEKLSDIFESEDWGTETAEQAAKVYEDMADRLEEVYGAENDRVKLLRDEADRLKEVNYLTAEQQEEERKRAMYLALGIDVDAKGEDRYKDLEHDEGVKANTASASRESMRKKMDEKDDGNWYYGVDTNGKYKDFSGNTMYNNFSRKVGSKRQTIKNAGYDTVLGYAAYGSAFEMKDDLMSPDWKVKNRTDYSDIIVDKLANWISVNSDGREAFNMAKPVANNLYADDLQAMEGFIEAVDELSGIKGINDDAIYREAKRVADMFRDDYDKVQSEEDAQYNKELQVAAAKWFVKNGGFDSDKDVEDFKNSFNGQYSKKRIEKFFNDYINKNEGIYYTKEYREKKEAEKKEQAEKNRLESGIPFTTGELKEVSEAISSVSKAFNEMHDEGYVTLNTIDSIKSNVKLSADEWSRYENVLLTAEKGSAEFNRAISDLTYKTLEAKLGADTFVLATEEQIAAMLRENGVANADALAIEYLARAKAQAKIDSEDFKNINNGEIESLIKEGIQAGITEGQMYNLILAHIQFNSTNLDATQKINALKEVAIAAGIASDEVNKIFGANSNSTWSDKQSWADQNKITIVEDAQGRTGKREDGSTYKYKDYIYNGVQYDTVDDANAAITQDRIRSKFESQNEKFDFTTPTYTPKNNKKEKDKDKKDDAEKKALEALKKSLDARKEVIERYKEFIELTDFGLDLSQEDDFGLKTELLTGKISQLTSYGQAMREEFDRIANTIPNTSDEAEALASRLKSLGSDMRSNITEIRKTKIELQKLTINMASTLIDDRMGELQGQLDDIDSQIKILNSDYKDDFSHVSRMLSMNMLLPSYSDFGVSRAKLSNANRDLIRGEQETQNIINDMIETQIAKNEELREEERQAILADMETMRQDVILHLNNVSEDYESSWDSISTETNDGIGTIETAINNMDLTIPEPDISNVVKACELVKEMLDNMGDAEYTPPKIKVTDGVDGGDDAKSIVSGNRSNIVSNVAKNQLGVPYVWGGIAPGIGLDCSGLTQYAYRVAGVSLPRVADDQWRCGLGTVVDWGNLKKGDQLFFGDDGHASHTGIYVGNGQMIHAPRTGDVIKYSSINNEYYQGRFLGAKRYAVGTPGGNALAKNLGIAGENYKPEILVDKATGETTYIDTPTVIDVSKTDVVGEKATASIPKFATGTPTSDPELLSIVKRVCEATGIPANVLLSVIDQETGNKWYNGIMDSNGYKSYGYMMINDSYINGLNSGYANKVRTDPYTNVLEGAKILLDNFAKLGNWADAASAYNQGLGGFQKNGRNKYGNDVWNRANTKAFLNALEGVDGTGDIPTTVSAQELIQVLEEEYQKAIDWGLKPYLEEIKNGTVQSVFGNVDMDKRTIITWSDELKKTYKNALASWEYDPEVGSVDTVFGGSGRFGEDINGAGWEVAFTPILPNGTFLSKDTVYDYINNILVEAYGNDKQVTANELKAIDAEGRQVGETFVNGIFAAIDDSLSYDNNGNWAETVGRLMHFSGDFGAVELARTDVGKLLSTEKIEDFYDFAVSEIGKANSKYSTQYLDILNDRSLGDFEKNEQLYDIQYAMGLNSSKIGTEIYDFVYGQYRNWLADVEANPENWDYDTHESFVETLKKLNEFAYKSADDAVSSKQAAAQMRWDNSEGWISDRNFFNDWGLFDDTEVDAWERVVAWLKKEYPKEVSKIKDAEKNLFEARKKEFDKANTFSNTYLESQKTLLQSHFDVTNAVAEARHEINKELETSMTMYEYLDEDTRKLLFNQEDYNALSEELLTIQDKANNLQKQYEADLKGSTLDTIESITSNYQMQYETLMKSYEIAKADLEVAKKKAKLNNVLNERNVRMFVNGSWQWVANTEDVANAKSELADAEYEKQTSQTNLEQQNSLNALTRQQDELSVVMKKFESGIIGLNEAVGLATGIMGNMPGELYKMYLNSTPDTKAYSQGAASGTYEGTWYDGVTDYMDEILKASSREDVLALNAARTAKIKGGNLKEAILSDEEAIAKWREQVIAKMHTNSKDWHSADDETKKALAAQNQIWGEAIGSTYDKVTGSWSHDGIFVPISPSSIFNSDMFGGDRLKNIGTLWNTGFNIGTGALSAVQPQQVDQSQDNRIIINGMTVDTGTMAGKDLYDALLRFVGNH